MKFYFGITFTHRETSLVIITSHIFHWETLLTMVSKDFGSKYFSELHNVGMIHLLPHVYNTHTLRMHEAEPCKLMIVIKLGQQIKNHTRRLPH